MKDTPNATDAIPEIPLATPWMNVCTMLDVDDDASAVAREAPSLSTPRPTIQSWIFANASRRAALISSLSETRPPTTSSTITAPSDQQPDQHDEGAGGTRQPVTLEPSDRAATPRSRSLRLRAPAR